MASITSTGIGSGLDINGLVKQLVTAERTPTASRLSRQESQVQAKISALGNVSSAFSTLRSSLSSLKNISNYQKVSASSSDNESVTVSADNTAEIANYKIEVKSLAQSHALASKRFDAANDVVGTGTLTIKLGTTQYDATTDTYSSFEQNSKKGTLTLDINSSNNTLTGLRDAINGANAGVSAAVINDGGGYRLVLNSSENGADNSLQVSVEDSDFNATTNPNGNIDAAGLSTLAFNAQATQMEQTQVAKSAKIAINGLEVTSSNNTVNTALKGMTFNLQKAQEGKIVDVTIKQNTDDLTSAVQNFVKSFNDTMSAVTQVASYDKVNKTAGVLQSEGVVRSAVSSVRLELANFAQGIGGNTKALSEIGISVQRDGALSLDSSKLSDALRSDRSGVMALFTVIGRPTDPGVLYSSSTTGTRTGDYAVAVTQAATQGYFNGTTANSYLVDANNDTFSIKVDGVQSGSITLTQGDYSNSRNSLAAEIQSRINGDTTLKSNKVSVNVSYDSANNRFMIQSNRFGSASKVEITQVDTNSTATLGLQVASRASLNGTTINSLVVDANNDNFSIKVDGVQSGLIALSQGDYSNNGTALATEIQSQINSDSTLKSNGASVGVTYDSTNNRFVIQSNQDGIGSKVEITQVDTNSTATLGLQVAASNTVDAAYGKDIEGTIGGLKANGQGQELLAAQGSAQGLKLLISDSTVGDRGTVRFSRGLVERLDKVLAGLVDANGILTKRSNNLGKDLEQIQETQSTLDQRMSDYEARLLKQFNSMDSLLGRFQATGSYLTQQLGTLPLASKQSNN
jgi:flagellar hook-associated protein 2